MPLDESALAASLAALLATADPAGVQPEQALLTRLGQVVMAADEVLRVDCVGLLLLDDVDVLRIAGSSGPAAAALEVAQKQLGVGPGIDGLTAAQTITVSDLAEVPAYASLWESLQPAGVRAVLSAPIRMQGQVIGNLNALCGYVHVWTPAEITAAEAYANLVGVQLRLAAQARQTDGLVAQLQARLGSVTSPGDLPEVSSLPVANGRRPGDTLSLSSDLAERSSPEEP